MKSRGRHINQFVGALVVLLTALCAQTAIAQEPAPAAAAAPAAPPAAPATPALDHTVGIKQVVVSMKILEFTATEGVETGFSAYYAKVPRTDAMGNVTTSSNVLNSIDLTFPSSTTSGITVFLDKISTSQGDLEFVLQALEEDSMAYILSRPRAMVPVNSPKATIIKTTQSVPYENTQVVGTTAVQITSFEETGVMLTVKVPEVYDLDGDARTTNDTFVSLELQAEIKEEGQRIVIALDDQLASGGDFSLATNAIQVPEFINRMINTKVWLRDGQVLLLGGLYRNLESRTLSTIPFLRQTENIASTAIENAVNVAVGNPISATIGNRREEKSRRELVFLIKAERWRESFAIEDEFGFEDPDEEEEEPKDVISTVTDGISNLFRSSDVEQEDISEEGE